MEGDDSADWEAGALVASRGDEAVGPGPQALVMAATSTSGPSVDRRIQIGNPPLVTV